MRTKVDTRYYMEEKEEVCVTAHEDGTISAHKQPFFLNMPLDVAKQLSRELYEAINKIETAEKKRKADEKD